LRDAVLLASIMVFLPPVLLPAFIPSRICAFMLLATIVVTAGVSVLLLITVIRGQQNKRFSERKRGSLDPNVSAHHVASSSHANHVQCSNEQSASWCCFAYARV
jgi:hypothetical protein